MRASQWCCRPPRVRLVCGVLRSPAFAQSTVSAEKRVQSDLEEMTKHPIEGIAVIPRDNNIGVWQIFVEGTKVRPLGVGAARWRAGAGVALAPAQEAARRRAGAACAFAVLYSLRVCVWSCLRLHVHNTYSRAPSTRLATRTVFVRETEVAFFVVVGSYPHTITNNRAARLRAASSSWR